MIPLQLPTKTSRCFLSMMRQPESCKWIATNWRSIVVARSKFWSIINITFHFLQKLRFLLGSNPDVTDIIITIDAKSSPVKNRGYLLNISERSSTAHSGRDLTSICALQAFREKSGYSSSTFHKDIRPSSNP